MFNKNFLIDLKGNEIISIKETTESVESKIKDNWQYCHSNNWVYSEEIYYGVQFYEGENYSHKMIVSFYSELPLEGFDFHFPMIHGGVNLEDFAKSISRTYIPGSCLTPEQIAYNNAMMDSYFNDRD